MNVEKNDTELLKKTVDIPEEGLHTKIAKHSFRDRDTSKEVSPERFNTSSAKTATDRLEQAKKDARNY